MSEVGVRGVPQGSMPGPQYVNCTLVSGVYGGLVWVCVCVRLSVLQPALQQAANTSAAFHTSTANTSAVITLRCEYFSKL